MKFEMNNKQLGELLKDLVCCPNKIEAELIIKEVQSRFSDIQNGKNELIAHCSNLDKTIQELIDVIYDQKLHSDNGLINFSHEQYGKYKSFDTTTDLLEIKAQVIEDVVAEHGRYLTSDKLLKSADAIRRNSKEK